MEYYINIIVRNIPIILYHTLGIGINFWVTLISVTFMNIYIGFIKV